MHDPEDIVELSSVPKAVPREGVPGQRAAAAGAGGDQPASGEAAGGTEAEGGSGGAGRPYLRLWFECAGQYQRAYRNASATEYNARCAKCGQTVRFPVGPGGSSERFFKVSCL